MQIGVAGEPCVLRAAGTLWLPQHKTLVVSDLHLEKGSAYAAKGQLLPPYDTRETLDRLLAEVAETQPRTLILLGDSLHDMGAISRIPVAEREAVIELAQQLDLVWISGNHDPDGGAAFGGRSTDEIQLGHLTLRHEPQAGLQVGEVAGHLHPCARVIGPAGAVRRRCFLSDGQRLILPAFGAYTGGLNALDSAYDGLFTGKTCAYLLGHKITPVATHRLAPDGRQAVTSRARSAAPSVR
ncbi:MULTISPECIES: ligase-associated DNA damage response endonuclease PdeM [unclassified Brevundimonas]|uniref:ligase-associated DNA damage response endonuclease PdeM n=1 Tax=unclassified Brevundimonas TaxID=2622653 RepID=UPI0025C5816C|nr:MULTISPECIES: ligase-associated DNA damage response endonuclease PdeM [unclassified Brevundimonas]